MPYVKQQVRKDLDQVLTPLIDAMIVAGPGELNYVITKLINGHLDLNQGASPNYKACNEAIGVLECCKLELYRKIVAPYEDLKEKENGPVYGVTDEDLARRSEGP